MRFNKQKRHRRTVRFYTACFGFRAPFKVLCDGTFIHHLVANNITPHDKAVSNTLGRSVKLFTTRCVLGELNSLGASHAESLKDANHHFNIARCEHEKRINAPSCIADIIGENNSEHFFVATQDAYMRKKLRQIPGVPVMYGLRNTLFLEQPSSDQREFVNSSEEKRKHVSEKEVELLQKIANSGSTGDESAAEEFAAIKNKISKDGVDLKDKAQFKRKKTKLGLNFRDQTHFPARRKRSRFLQLPNPRRRIRAVMKSQNPRIGRGSGRVKAKMLQWLAATDAAR